jgi:hydroxymethylpyrimidine pyrophosphatase-like HAD family hydrolase
MSPKMNVYKTLILQILNTTAPKENSVIVYDIDDTLIESSSNLPISPIVDTYKHALSKGFKLAIITARPGTIENIKWTQEQLNIFGITDYTYLYFRPPDKSDQVEFKLKSRKNLVERGYNVEMSIGDMWWDVGLYGGKGVHLA